MFGIKFDCSVKDCYFMYSHFMLTGMTKKMLAILHRRWNVRPKVMSAELRERKDWMKSGENMVSYFRMEKSQADIQFNPLQLVEASYILNCEL